MSNILNIETSSKNCSVSIGTDGALNALCEEISQDFKHSENLHTFVQWALEGANLALKDIDAICVGAGPGSYTGLRIGVATAKGFAFGNDVPLLAVDTLYILANKYFDKEYDFIIPLMDARRMEVYTSVFDKKGNIIEDTQAHILNENSFEKYGGSKILFIGDAVEKTKEFFITNSSILANETFELAYPSAENMVNIAEDKYSRKEFEDIAYFDPQYLKNWEAKK